MSKKISIAIDAMGGDNSPGKTIQGVKLFLDKYKSNDDFILNIFGKEEEIKKKLKEFNIVSNSINLINSNTVVSDEESPMTAVKNSRRTRRGGTGTADPLGEDINWAVEKKEKVMTLNDTHLMRFGISLFV